MWPDWAKFWHFGKITFVFRQIFASFKALRHLPKIFWALPPSEQAMPFVKPSTPPTKLAFFNNPWTRNSRVSSQASRRSLESLITKLQVTCRPDLVCSFSIPTMRVSERERERQREKEREREKERKKEREREKERKREVTYLKRQRQPKLVKISSN